MSPTFRDFLHLNAPLQLRIVELTDKVSRKINSTYSTMVSKAAEREIVGETRIPFIDVLLCARDIRWSYARVHSTNRRATNSPSEVAELRRAKTGSIVCDEIDEDVNTTVSLAKDRIELQKNRPTKRSYSHLGTKHTTHSTLQLALFHNP